MVALSLFLHHRGFGSWRLSHKYDNKGKSKKSSCSTEADGTQAMDSLPCTMAMNKSFQEEPVHPASRKRNPREIN